MANVKSDNIFIHCAVPVRDLAAILKTCETDERSIFTSSLINYPHEKLSDFIREVIKLANFSIQGKHGSYYPSYEEALVILFEHSLITKSQISALRIAREDYEKAKAHASIERKEKISQMMLRKNLSDE